MSVIPKEQIAAYERWQVDSFDETSSNESSSPNTSTSDSPEGELVSGVKLPTAEQLERIQIDAQQEGYDAGHAAGFAEGQQAGLAAAQLQVERMDSLLAHLETSIQQLDQTVANAVLDLAMETARQVVRGAIKAQPELLLPVIREAIATLPLHHGNITLHLHTDDAVFIREHLGEQLPQSGWQLLEDTSVEPGGCHLKAGASEVDATLPTRWQRVLEAIGATPTEAPADSDPQTE